MAAAAGMAVLVPVRVPAGTVVSDPVPAVETVVSGQVPVVGMVVSGQVPAAGMVVSDRGLEEEMGVWDLELWSKGPVNLTFLLTFKCLLICLFTI